MSENDYGAQWQVLAGAIKFSLEFQREKVKYSLLTHLQKGFCSVGLQNAVDFELEIIVEGF